MDLSGQEDLLASAAYGDDHIQSHEGLQIIRERLTQYIDDSQTAGQIHIAKEICDNSNDEIQQLGHGYFVVVLCRDPERATYQIVVRDTGRGIPIGRSAKGDYGFVRAMTQPHTSGKFGQTSYLAAAGTFGLGAKVAAGTSEFFRALSHRPEGTASLLVQKGQHGDTPEFDMTAPTQTGVTIAYEPDKSLLFEVDTFSSLGYIGLIELLKKYVFFRYSDIKFRISETPLPSRFWTAPIAEADVILTDIEQNAELVWSADQFDAEAWLKQFWDVDRNWTWSHKITHDKIDDPNLIRTVVKLYHLRYQRLGKYLGMVNTVPINAPTSDHITVVLNSFRTVLSRWVDKTDVKEFFLKNYELPVYLAVDVSYKGAVFVGATKHNFRMPPFRAAFSKVMEEYWDSKDGRNVAQDFYDLIKEDIEVRYKEFLKEVKKNKNKGKLFTQLIRPQNFDDCSNKDRSEAELFLVEGKSAGGSTDYDVVNQAIYQLRGKPKNIVRAMLHNSTKAGLAKAMMANEVFHDVFTVIGYDPLNPSLDNLNFKHALLMVDSDSHGGHIASLLLGNIYAVAPELVESGFFGIVAPPYYKIHVDALGKTATYVKDQEGLVQWYAKELFFPHYSVSIVDRRQRLERRVIDQEAFIPFVEAVYRIGETFDNLDKELSIPAYLLEALCECTYYLTHDTMNVTEIHALTGVDSVHYDAVNRNLVLAVGFEDYTIPIASLQNRIYNTVLPLLHQISWKLFQLFLTNKKGSHHATEPVSLYQLYTVFKRVADKHLKVEVLKGIGSMDTIDAAKTCMDPKNRRVYYITSVGDVEHIFNLLGNDTASRKELLADD